LQTFHRVHLSKRFQPFITFLSFPLSLSSMKQSKMRFLEIPMDIKSIRVSLGLDKAKNGKENNNNNNNNNNNDKEKKKKRKNKQQRHNQSRESSEPQQTYHLDWAIVPYVQTQFPSLHRDVITLEEFAEEMAEAEAEMEREEEARRKNNQREVVTDSESDDTEDQSEAETRSSEESSDSEMDEFIVDDDKEDTDKEEEEDENAEDEELLNPENEAIEKKKPTKKDKLKKELSNLGLSSGQVGESFAVATEGLGKRKRRQTDHLATRVFQAGEISREIDDYDCYNFETKKFKKEAYHKSGSTKSLWEKPKNSVLAITGANASWAKKAAAKRDNASIKKAKPGQRPCSATAQAANKKARRNADIRSYLVR